MTSDPITVAAPAAPPRTEMTRCTRTQPGSRLISEADAQNR